MRNLIGARSCKVFLYGASAHWQRWQTAREKTCNSIQHWPASRLLLKFAQSRPIFNVIEGFPSGPLSTPCNVLRSSLLDVPALDRPVFQDCFISPLKESALGSGDFLSAPQLIDILFVAFHVLSLFCLFVFSFVLFRSFELRMFNDWMFWYIDTIFSLIRVRDCVAR